MRRPIDTVYAFLSCLALSTAVVQADELDVARADLTLQRAGYSDLSLECTRAAVGFNEATFTRLVQSGEKFHYQSYNRAEFPNGGLRFGQWLECAWDGAKATIRHRIRENGQVMLVADVKKAWKLPVPHDMALPQELRFGLLGEPAKPGWEMQLLEAKDITFADQPVLYCRWTLAHGGLVEAWLAKDKGHWPIRMISSHVPGNTTYELRDMTLAKLEGSGTYYPLSVRVITTQAGNVFSDFRYTATKIAAGADAVKDASFELTPYPGDGVEDRIQNISTPPEDPTWSYDEHVFFPFNTQEMYDLFHRAGMHEREETPRAPTTNPKETGQ